MNQVLYGVGKSILRQFTDESKIVALSKLRDVTISASGDEEKVYGGDSAYAFASFPREKAITISATNSSFDLKMVNATQGANIGTKEMVFTEVETYIVPSDGVVTLDYTPDVDSVVIEGFTSTTVSPASTGEFYVTGSTVEFNTGDAGKEVDIVYERTVANAEVMEVLKDTMAKPFKFIHRIPIYDGDNNVVGQGQLVVYKCKATNSFEFNLARETAFAPALEFEAQDPKRPDGKLWDFAIETVAVA